MENPDWRCKIDEGMAGLVTVKWSPDSRHILTTAEFNVSLLSLKCFSGNFLFLFQILYFYALVDKDYALVLD